jgi:hypothetical protein
MALHASSALVRDEHSYTTTCRKLKMGRDLRFALDRAKIAYRSANCEWRTKTMECPQCGTWNPDDKNRCWRCSAELPKPPEKKKSKTSTQTWFWVVAILLFALTLLFQCGVFRIGDAGETTGSLWLPLLALGRAAALG